MLNTQLKKEALKNRERELEQYRKLYVEMVENCDELYEVRQNGVDMVGKVEEFINSIAKTPKRFSAKLLKLEIEKREFKDTLKCIEESKRKLAKHGVSLAVGAGVGAALTVAAKSGAKFLGKKAILALSGPLGWGIALVVTGVELYTLGEENKVAAEKIELETEEIIKECFTVKSFCSDVEDLRKRTMLLQEKTEKGYVALQQYKGWNYRKLPFWIRLRMGVLVNCTLALSELLNKEL